jgi:Kdo2-lipid IVA lauroyltransferase/acyltransferase
MIAPMNDISASFPVSREHVHAFRRTIFSAERTYRLAADGLEWRDDAAAGAVAYRDIVAVHEYKSKVWGALAAELPRRFDYVLHGRDGARIFLNSTHVVRFRVAENRAASCMAFVTELKARIAAANPDVKVFNKLSWSYRFAMAADRARYSVGHLLFKLIRRLDIDRAANFAGWALRKIGPRLRGHRTGRLNLTAAYPEKSAAEIERILAGMWDNLGRLAVEYINLDRLIGPDPNAGRMVVPASALQNLIRMRDDGRPAVAFTSHLASYEVGAIWGKRNGLDLAILYNPLNFGPLSEELLAMREASMGRLVASGRDTAGKFREAMKEGLHLTLFVDQHHAQGVEVTFFGRRCKANPMAARFARLFDCPVHGFRTIRLPDNRIALDLSDELEMPRDADGKIDVAAGTQAITSVVEGWIRERPEQWLWLQRRWR